MYKGQVEIGGWFVLLARRWKAGILSRIIRCGLWACGRGFCVCVICILLVRVESSAGILRVRVGSVSVVVSVLEVCGGA